MGPSVGSTGEARPEATNIPRDGSARKVQATSLDITAANTTGARRVQPSEDSLSPLAILPASGPVDQLTNRTVRRDHEQPRSHDLGAGKRWRPRPRPSKLRDISPTRSTEPYGSTIDPSPWFRGQHVSFDEISRKYLCIIAFRGVKGEELACIANERGGLESTRDVSRVWVVVIGDHECDGRPRAVFFCAQDGESLGFHGHLEVRDLSRRVVSPSATNQRVFP